MTVILAALTQTQLATYGTFALVAGAVAFVAWTLGHMINRFGLERAERLSEVDRGPNTIYHFISRGALVQLRLTVFVIVAGLLAAVLLLFDAGSPLVWIGVPILVGFLATFGPLLYFQRKVKARAALFADQLLDLSLGLANGLKSGQALPQAMDVFSRNCPDPMREELAVVLREHRLGIELTDALDRMYERIPCEDLQLLCSAIRLTTKSGGSLAEVIQKITNLIRARIDFRRRLDALTAQGRFEALAMSLAPAAAFVLLFFADRDLMIPLVTTGLGWLAIAGDVVLVTVGYLIIRKIVDIDI